MNPLLIALLGAAVGYTRTRAKTKKLSGALMWGAGAYAAAVYGAPAVRRMLPRLSA